MRELITWEAMQANGTIVVEAKLIDACSEACPEHHSRPQGGGGGERRARARAFLGLIRGV